MGLSHLFNNIIRFYEQQHIELRKLLEKEVDLLSKLSKQEKDSNSLLTETDSLLNNPTDSTNVIHPLSNSSPNPLTNSFLELNTKTSYADIAMIFHKFKEHVEVRLKQELKKLSVKHNVRVAICTVDDIDLDKNQIRSSILIDGNKETIEDITIPRYIYNFVLHTKRTSVSKIRKLRLSRDIDVINPVNRFFQPVLFEMITSITHSKQMVLPYKLFSKSGLKAMVKENSSFYVLPQRSSTTHRVITVQRNSNKSQSYLIRFGKLKLTVSESQLYYQIKKIVKNKKYFLMKAPSQIKKWDGSPLEIRGYLQKNESGKWIVHHFLAKKDMFTKDSIFDTACEELKNVLVDVLPKEMTTTMNIMAHYLLDIGIILDYYIPNLASCYVDFIVDEEGSPYVVQIGGVDQQDYLLEVNNYEWWQHSIQHIFHYLLNLTQKERGKHDMG